MANIYIERAYIEDNSLEDSHQILIHIKENNDHILAGKVELEKDISWIHFSSDQNGDLFINNSAGMEANKWNHITYDIINNDFGIGRTIELGEDNE